MIGFEPISTGGGGGPVKAINVEYLNGAVVNVQEALDSLLYVNPAVSSFTNNIGTVEKGSVITSVVLAWSFNKTMASASINNGIGSVQGVTTIAHTAQNITTNRTYTITVNDGTNNASRNTNVIFQNKRYHGTSANADLASFDILSLQNSELSDSRLQTRTINGNGQYIYFAFPESFGVPVFNVNGLVNTAFTSIIKSFTNSKGHTENYRLVRMNTLQFGTLTIETK